MPKQLYVVTLTTEVVVLAESIDEAETVGLRHASDETEWGAEAEEMRHVPADYEDDHVVYTSERGTYPTLGECIARGQAPRLRKGK